MSNWNALDKFIAKIRYSKIKKFVPENGIICDVGCGQDGAFLMEFSNSIKKGYGFDWKTENRVIKNIKLQNNKNLPNIPLDNESCDAVFLIAVLEHLEKPEKILYECIRILRGGGIFVLTTPTKRAQPILEFMAYKLHIINSDEISEHKHYYSETEIKKLFKNCGLTNHKVNYSSFCFGLNSIASGMK